ncbi:MAG: efflux RND transporter permease subunit, partial [Leptospiraceae bacterium]|nr:efflux RND transporter permease subunit [Leptospiraceae bacterium]
MTLADISIKKPVFAWMIFWGTIFIGLMSFRNLGISQMPDVDFPVINIKLTMPGASPEVMETNVVDLIEDGLITIDGVTKIGSSSGMGQASITLELELDKNVDSALQEVQTKIYQVQKLLPNTLEPPIITRYNPEDSPIIWIAATYEGSTRDLMIYVRDVLKNQFSIVPGVGQIRLGGFSDRNLRIWIDPKKLSSLELSVDDIINAIKKEHIEDPGGLIENESYQKSIRSMGEAKDISVFKKIRIPSRGNLPILERQIFLGDVAEIEDGLEDLKRISRFNTVGAVGIGIIKQRGTNAVEVARKVKEKTEELKESLPKGFKLNVSFDSSIFIEESIEELEFTLILSVILTAIVCFFFLGNWSSTWNILLSIPTSIIGSFFIINFFGFTLNTFTLLALSLAIGIVVDDAIMVLENIFRHKEMGKTRMDAAKKGSREITFAAIATTLSIVAIFLPVVFMKGIIGKYFYQFGVVLSSAVLLSLLEALTLTPMRASRYLEVGSNQNKLFNLIQKFFQLIDEAYIKLLEYSLNHKLSIIILAIGIFVITSIPLLLLKKEFVPSMDQSKLFAKVQAPIGTSIKKMDSITKEIESTIIKEKEVERLFAAVGGFQGGQSNLANLFITLKDKKDRPIDLIKGKPLTQNEFASILRKKMKENFPEVKVAVQDLSTRGFSASRGFPVELSIQGRDWKLLASKTEIIIEEMKKTEMFTDIDSTYEKNAPEILIYPDRNKTHIYGVNIDSIGTTISAMIGGIKIGQFTDSGHRYDIAIRLKSEFRKSIDQVKNIYVRNQRSELVNLSNIIIVEEKASLPAITRINRERAITIYANPANNIGQKEAIEKAKEIATNILPGGYSARSTGSSEVLKDSFNSLYLALFIGVLIAYMILASQFNSFSQPLIVLLALPFSFSGAIFSLWIFGYSLNIYSFIALLLLMGLVKKNSIMLVDFTNKYLKDSQDIRTAILKACPTRLRPILMTSIATIAA